MSQSITEYEQLYINEFGEAVNENPIKNDSKYMNNAFLKLSDDLIENWSPSITENAAKTWRQTLQSSYSSISKNLPSKMATINQKQKEEVFLQDFLNAILPPIATKIITEQDNNNDEQIAYSLVSTKQATRTQLIEIRNNFEQLIKQRRAREMGLDNIRYQLAFQLFDEIIRQSSIDCKERGLLLLRMRDEAKMTLQSYGILKQIASTFSINEGEKSNQGFEQLIEKRNEMLEKKKKLENELLKLQNKLSDTQKEVQVKEEVMIQQLEQQKHAFENEGAHLRILIDQKRGRSGRTSRRKSLNPSARNRLSTRRASVKDPNKSFNFKSLSKSPPTSPKTKI